MSWSRTQHSIFDLDLRHIEHNYTKVNSVIPTQFITKSCGMLMHLKLIRFKANRLG